MKKCIIVIIFILCLSIILSCFAHKTKAVGLSDVLSNPDAFIEDDSDNEEAKAIGNVIVWLVRTIGESGAVIMLLIIGIKYILGSVEEKAEYKKSMWPYILGAILIFSGAALTDIIYKAFQTV